MSRNQLSHLAVLSVVAQHGSFRAAARELGIAPSAVSHAVSVLEARLGVRLLARTTRSVAPTGEGAALLERLRPALSEIDLALEQALEARDRPAGKLRLNVPRTAAELALAPRLAAFAAAYPDITLEIVSEDRFTDVVEGGFDAGVRLGESLQRDMIAVRIGFQLRGAVVAAPSCLAGRELPLHPRDLANHRCIRFRFSSGVIYRWEFEKEGEEIVMDVDGPRSMAQASPSSLKIMCASLWRTGGWCACWRTGARPSTASSSTIPAASRCARRSGPSWISFAGAAKR
jgi:DNA-binding transcriptional LysR family regulator